MAGTIFGCGVRGLPAWYQALTAVLLAASLVLMWCTHLVDPGVLPPRDDRDPVIVALETGEGNVRNRARYGKDERGTWIRTMSVAEWAAEREQEREQGRERGLDREQGREPESQGRQQQGELWEGRQRLKQRSHHEARNGSQRPAGSCAPAAPAPPAAPGGGAGGDLEAGPAYVVLPPGAVVPPAGGAQPPYVAVDESAAPSSAPPPAVAKGSVVVSKYCSTCNIWRPARGHHCRVCGYCMVCEEGARG
ncbi:hypothetical protein TSOC_010376 [Tetrabaena socialis]|uniref:Protein S-acyltransferase n=1 Tax=Tetrabaena socialis TaxID=47790 RepID=A0A2J7ZTF6_9CHLO|nr:hypothetical protein TSOC_010376 [Tetrabaena socialis]|eukprot:PNH03553.1 hypothetical protein TSOC_010376 [Tetrabaena socialis]